jgi:hypothetical protein
MIWVKVTPANSSPSYLVVKRVGPIFFLKTRLYSLPKPHYLPLAGSGGIAGAMGATTTGSGGIAGAMGATTTGSGAAALGTGLVGVTATGSTAGFSVWGLTIGGRCTGAEEPFIIKSLSLKEIIAFAGGLPSFKVANLEKKLPSTQPDLGIATLPTPEG